MSFPLRKETVPQVFERDSMKSKSRAKRSAAEKLLPQIEVNTILDKLKTVLAKQHLPPESEVREQLVLHRWINRVCNRPRCGRQENLELCSKCLCSWYVFQNAI